MKTPLIIYCRAVGFYALLTLPLLASPFGYFYFMSLWYVLIYGWFACAVFTILYLITIRGIFDRALRFVLLFIAVVAAVAFAYQMLEVLHAEQDVWHSEFIIFPFLAVIVGWISVCVSRETVIDAGTQKHGDISI
jgi:hypothetical protein